jgi:hypothetical protein
MICFAFASYSSLALSGGKSGAATIDNDHDFSVALSALLKKKKDTCGVGVEFDADSMDGYRIKKRVSLSLIISVFVYAHDTLGLCFECT